VSGGFFNQSIADALKSSIPIVLIDCLAECDIAQYGCRPGEIRRLISHGGILIETIKSIDRKEAALNKKDALLCSSKGQTPQDKKEKNQINCRQC